MVTPGNAYKIRIRGEYGCFTRPEMKADRVSYEIITPSAAIGVLESVFWKPEIRWRVHEIAPLAPARFMNIRRNEVQHVVGPRAVASAARGVRPKPYDVSLSTNRVQRNTLLLRDPDFAVTASFDIVVPLSDRNNIPKYHKLFAARMDTGACHQQPYMGCREFPAVVEWYTGNPPIRPETRDLGMMSSGVIFGANSNATDFFPAVLDNGIVYVPQRD